MLNADQAHGRPIIVSAMMKAASTQPAAIHRPPNTIHNMFSRNDTGDIGFSLCSNGASFT